MPSPAAWRSTGCGTFCSPLVEAPRRTAIYRPATEDGSRRGSRGTERGWPGGERGPITRPQGQRVAHGAVRPTLNSHERELLVPLRASKPTLTD